MLQTLTSGLNNPVNITLDSKGDVWVANWSGNTVAQFSASGILLQTLSKGITNPFSVVVDGGGNVWVANHGNTGSVEKFSANGALLQTFTNGVTGPQSLTVDSNGNVWVANATGNTVQEFGLPSPATLTSAAYLAATGQLTLTGQFLPGSSGLYVATDLSLKGDGGSVYQLTSGSAIIGTPTSTSLTLQLSAADQLAVDGLLNKNGGLANDGTGYNLSAAAGWAVGAAAVTSVATSVNNATTPSLSAVAYNAATGVFSFTGNQLVNHGSISGINLGDLSFTSGATGKFNFNSTDSVHNFASSGFTVTLSAADTGTVNALLSGAVGNLNALAGWDSDSGAAINGQSVVLPPLLTAVSYNVANGQLTLTGTNLTTTAAGYLVRDLSLKGSGGGSYQLSSGSLVIGTPTSSSVTIQLSSTDQKALGNLFNNNGTQANDGTSYNLSASTGWDTGAGAIGKAAVTVTGLTPVLTGVSYSAATGQLSLTGQHLASSASNYTVTDFSLKGDGGTAYQLTSGSAIVGTPTSGSFSIQLSAADQLAVDGLLNKNGGLANDGTAYSLSATAGWDNGASAISSAITVASALAPTLSAVAYNAATGVFTFTGSQLDNHGTANGINLADLSFTTGGAKFTFSGSDTVSNLNSSGFSITLSSTDQVSVNGLLNGAATGNLTASAGWDSNSGTAIGSQTVAISSPPVVSTVSYNAAIGQLTLTGQYLANTASSYTVTDFSLKGDGGATYQLTSGSAVVGAPTSSGFTVQLSVADQLAIDGLLNKNGGLANDGTAYSLSATAGWDTGTTFGAALGAVATSVSNATMPSLSVVAYNAATGVFSFTGSQLDNHGSANGINLADLSFTTGGATFTFNSSDTVSNLNSSGFSITLSSTDQASVNGLLNGAATGNLTASAGWDSNSGTAIGSQSVAISSPPVVSTVSYNAAIGQLTLTGQYLANTASSYTVTDFSLKGDGGTVYQLTSGSSITGTPTGGGVTIQLSTADQLAIDGLLNKNGGLANDGSAYSLSVTAGWETNAGAISSVSTTVNNATMPSLSAVAYNTATGVFTFTGSQLDNHGTANGINLADFSFTTGGTHFTFNNTDSLSKLKGGGFGFTITLSGADQTTVNSLLNGATTGNLTALAGWDSDSGAAISSQTVAISSPPLVSAASYNAATGQLTLTGQYLTSTAGGYTVTDFSLKGNGGTVYQLTSGSAVVGSPTNSNVTIQLSAADQTAIGSLFNKNGAAASDGSTYNLSATAGWDTGAASITTEGVTVTGIVPTLNGASYSAATGLLTLSGQYLTTTAGNYTVTDFSLKGDGGTVYQLTSGSSITGTPTSSSVTIQLSAADQLAIDGLLNKTGGLANDGTSYSLSATSGWDTGAAAIGSLSTSVTSAETPTLTAVAYNAATGVFSFTGSQLDNHGSANGINLANLSLSIGGASFKPNTNDSVSNLNSSGFTITLSSTDQASVNGLLNGATTDNLTALAGWDSNSGAAISSQTVAISSPPVVSAASYNAATGQLTLTGQYLTTSAGSYNASDFSFKGNGGSVYQLTGSGTLVGAPSNTNITLQLSSADQTALANFFNKNGSQANDGTVYNLSATAGWDTGAAAIATEGVTVSGVTSGVVNLVLLQTLSSGVNGPTSLTVDSSGNVWVANSGNSTVEEFSASGKLLQTLSSGVNYPDSLAVDGSGNVWVANSVNNTVEEFSAGGNLLQILGSGVSYPRSLAVDGSGNVWVANWINNTVEEFSAGGKLLQILGSGVNLPQSLAVDGSGNVWVANYGNNTVEEFSASGKLLQTLSSGVNGLLSLAVDGSGNVWVANAGNNTVEEFSASGKLLQTRSSGVSGPESLAIDSSGNVWVANAGNNTVEEFGPPSTTALTNASYSAATGLLTLTGSNLTTAAGDYKVSSFSLQGDGNSIPYQLSSGSTLVGTPTSTSLTIQLSSADQLAVDGLLNKVGTQANDGTAYSLSATAGWDFVAAAVSSATLSVTSVETPTLSAVSYNASTGVFSFTGSQLDNHGATLGIKLSDLSFTIGATGKFNFNGTDSVSNLSSSGFTVTLSASDQASVNALLNGTTPGNLTALAGWDSNSGAAITSQSVSVPYLLLQTLSSGVSYPDSLAVDGSGNVWVANYFNNTVEEFSASGKQLQTLSSGVIYPYSLAIDRSGNVWVANFGNSTVEEFSASGKLLQTLGSGVSAPASLAVDGSGNVWVGNYGNNTVEEFSAGGKLMQTLSSGVSYPESLAVDGSGNVWVANAYNNTVEEFSASGKQLQTLSSGVSKPEGLAVDGSGNVWVGNLGTVNGFTWVSTVEEFSASGTLLQTLSSGVSYPESLAVDGSGNVWVANNSNNTIEEFGPYSGATAHSAAVELLGVNHPAI